MGKVGAIDFRFSIFDFRFSIGKNWLSRGLGLWYSTLCSISAAIRRKAIAQG
ncbi:hypothetical protein [Microcoleus sp. F4-D5]|uniref:hypothetical protein n=1 Tax=Microcoleus sp. F4-D5 TaxID=2818760 RepID=UPI002FD5BDD9